MPDKMLPQYQQYQTLLKRVFDAFGGGNLEWEKHNRKMKSAAEKGNKDVVEKEIETICTGIRNIQADGQPEAWKSLELFLHEVVDFAQDEKLKAELAAINKLGVEAKKEPMMELFLSTGLIWFGAEQMAALFRESQKRVQSPSEVMLDRILEEAKATAEKSASACANAVYDLEKWVWYQYFQAVFGMFSFIGIAISDDAAREIQPLDQQNEEPKEKVRYVPLKGV